MSATLPFDMVVKKAKAMRNRSFDGTFPEQAALWEKSLSNAMIHVLPVGIALFNRNFVLLNCNKLYQDYIDAYSYYSSKDVIGMEYFDFFGSQTSPLVDIFKTVRDNHCQHTSHEFPVRLDERIPQEITYWDAKLFPIRDHHNRIKGLVLFALDATEIVSMSKQLRVKDIKIQELKTSLRTLMKLRQEDLISSEQKAIANLKHIIEPFINNLRKHPLSSGQIANLDGIELGINEFFDESSYLFNSRQYVLTPKEIQVAAMIKMGKTTKDIAQCFHVSPASIDFHRKNIRAKLKLKNKKINLQSYLTSFFKP